MPTTKGVWLFLRVWIFGLYSASRYQGPGVGMGLLAAVCFQICVLGVGSAAVAVKSLMPKIRKLAA